MARTPASIKDHPIHPMLVALPLGLWVFSLVCDIVYRITLNPAWDMVALYTMGGGALGALLAAVPGFIDWLSLPSGSHTRRIGLWHMILNVAAVVLYAGNLWWRIMQTQRTPGPMILSLLIVVMLAASGWLGGALIYEHGVSVSGPPSEKR